MTLRRLGAAAAVVLGLVGCDDLLRVSNPGSLEEGQLADPSLEQFIVNGVIGAFQSAYGHHVLWSAVLADEAFTDHSNTDYRDLSLHTFSDQNVANESVYVSLQRARQSADDAVERLRRMLGAKAASSLNVARALIYGGYSYGLLGEGFCEAPVSLSAALPSRELLTRALARFDEGITVATAGRSGPSEAAARDLIDLARVGAARASLWKGDLVKARVYADSVPETYGRWAYYSANSTRENNALWLPVRTLQPWVGMHPAFLGLHDARAPQPAAPRASLTSNPIFPPLKPSMYSGWTGSGPAQVIEVSSHVRFASGLEARYVVVEADGPNAAMLTFVNARRAAGGSAPVSLGGAALLAEFRVQRALDFYLTGRRLGDLRRYREGGTDLFPAGKFPVSGETYGTMHCFIIPRSEKAGNPNL